MNQKEIARLAGVAHSTVSVVFGGKGRVSPKTREKVLKIAEEYGYHPSINFEAQNMVRRRHQGKHGLKTLGFLWPLRLGMLESLTYFKMFFSGILQSADKHGGSLLLFNMDAETGKMKSDPSWLVGLDAVLLFFPVEASFYEYARTYGVPVIAMATDHQEPGVYYIRLDEKAVVRKGLEHLSECGYRRLAFVGNRNDGFSSGPRSREFERWVLERNSEGFLSQVVMVDGGPMLNLDAIPEYFIEMGERGYQELKKAGPLPEAVLCHNDYIALGVIRGAAKDGVRVPEDMGILGTDATHCTEHATPRITSVGIGLSQMGEFAADLGMRASQGEKLPIESGFDRAHIVMGETLRLPGKVT